MNILIHKACVDMYMFVCTIHICIVTQYVYTYVLCVVYTHKCMHIQTCVISPVSHTFTDGRLSFS